MYAFYLEKTLLFIMSCSGLEGVEVGSKTLISIKFPPPPKKKMFQMPNVVKHFLIYCNVLTIRELGMRCD